MNQFIRKNHWVDSFIIAIFILAFTGAAINHFADNIRAGLFPYSKLYGANEYLNFYWTSLTILDPVAIITLFLNVRTGYIIALAIMFSDVPINIYATVNYWHLPLHRNYYLIMQIMFLAFLLLTVKRIWKFSQPSLISQKNSGIKP